MSEQAQEKKKITPVTLIEAVAVVLAVQLGALLITYQNHPVYISIVNSTGYSYDPLGTTTSASVGNAILLVGLAFGLTVGLVWLLRKKLVLSFKVVVFGSVAISASILTFTTADIFAYSYLPASYELPVAIGVPVIIVALIGYTIFVKNMPWLSTFILAFIGAEVGSFFADTLPLATAIILPVAFSAYDVYAVFKGPLKQLIGTDATVALTGMSIKAGEFTLGLGDIVFYTMLPSLAFSFIGGFAALSTILAIDVGVVATLFLLSRKRLLPGLPIPMALGVLTFLVFYF